MGAAKKQVMDVSKPGKAAASATARPVIIGHGSMVQDPMVRRAQAEADAEAAGAQPKRGKIVIKPLSQDSAADEDVKSRFAGVAATKAVPAKAEDKAGAAADPLIVAADQRASGEPDAATTQTAPPDLVLPELVDDAAEPAQNANESLAVPADVADAGQAVEDDAEHDDDTARNASDKPKSGSALADESVLAKDDKPKQDQVTDTDQTPLADDAASIDAVVSQASLKKASQDQEAKRKEQEAAIQKLVDDKTYFVHTSQPKAPKALRYFVGIIVFLLLLAGAYVAADAGAFGGSIKVPYHVFPQSKDVSDTPTNTAATPAKTVPIPAPTTPTTPAKLSQFKDVTLGLNFSYPTAWGTPTVESGKLNDTGTESVKTYRVTFKDLANAELRITQNNWASSQKAPGLTPLDGDGFTAMSATALAAPYLSVSTTDDSYVIMAYASSDKSVQLQAAKKLTLRLINAQYIEFYGTPVTGDKATSCTTGARTSSGAATRLPSKDCYTESDIKDVQNLVASMKAS